MASNEKVGWALAVLKHLPSSGPVTAETTAFYALGLRDVTDADLERAVGIAASRCTFRPTPAELRAFIPGPPAPDAEAVLSRIWALADYHPARGTTPPRVDAVRETFGAAIGEAYGIAGGGARLYSGNETTAAIARREFGAALVEALRAHGPAPEPMLALPSRESAAIVYDDAPRRVTAGGFRRIGA